MGIFTFSLASNTQYINLYPIFFQTSNTSTFLLHEVAKNPDLQDKLHKEVTSILGPDKHATFEDVQKMQLVRGCAKETLR